MAETLDNTIIVIEGQAGAGKTTVAQSLAESYGFSNFNTGTLFRATAAAMLYEGARLCDTDDFVGGAAYEIDTSDASKPLVAVGGMDVSDVLQMPEVTKVASHVGSAAKAAARLEKLFQENLKNGSMVVEGKHLADRMGKHATHMFFFTADFDVRAFRKWQQAQALGKTHYTLLEAQLDTKQNDARDRGLLTVAERTEIIDTTHLSPRQVVGSIARHI